MTKGLFLAAMSVMCSGSGMCGPNFSSPGAGCVSAAPGLEFEYEIPKRHVAHVGDGVDDRLAEIHDGRRLQRRVPALDDRSEEHTSELQSRRDLVCRLLLEKKK